MDHWRLKFGKIEPSVWNHGNEFRKMIVEGVEMYVKLARTKKEELRVLKMGQWLKRQWKKG